MMTESCLSSGSESINLLMEETSFTDVKSRPITNLQEDESNVVIAEADEQDEINTPLWPKRVGELQITSI